MTETYQQILFSVDQQVATITFNNPTQRNALGAGMREDLDAVLPRIRRDPNIRAVILTGAEGHFCAGGDVRAMLASAQANLDANDWRNRMRGLHPFVNELATLDRPVIAAVDGAAAGAGFSFACMADFVLVTPRTRFCMSFLKVGLIPDCGAFYLLPRIVGVQRAKELMLSARDVTGEEAVRLGIAMEMHAPEALLPRAQALAQSMVNASPAAVSMIKRALLDWGGELAPALDYEASGQAVAGTTREHKAAVGRFLSKEKPLFQWPVNDPASGQ